MSRTYHDEQMHMPAQSSEHRSWRPTRRTRRIAAAAGLLLTGAAVIGTGKLIVDGAHRYSELSTFSEPHLADNPDHMRDFAPNDVLIHKITSKDPAYPHDIAKKLGAKDVGLVEAEISSQVGGDRSVNPGETIVLPIDQLNPPQPTPKAS